MKFSNPVAQFSRAALVLALSLTPALSADINRVPDSLYQSFDRDGFGAAFYFQISSQGLPLNKMDRMGIATYEGNTYYAIRDQRRGIRVTIPNGNPANSEGLLREPNRADDAAGFFTPDTSRGAPFVAGLFPRDGLLYLVAFQEDNNNNGAIVYVQGFKRKSSFDPTLIPTDPSLNFKFPDSISSVNVFPISASDGIYIHFLSKQRSGGNPLLTTLKVTGPKAYTQTLTQIHQRAIAPTEMTEQRFAADGVATLEYMPATDELEEIHYLTWASITGPLYIYRYSAKYNRDTLTATATSIGRDNSIFHLVESGLSGDSIATYPLTLWQMYENSDRKLMMRTIGLTVQDHGSGFTGPWSNIDIRNYGKDDLLYGNDLYRNPGAAVISGVNKGDVTSVGTLDTTKKFVTEFQQKFKHAIITFKTFKGGSFENFVTFTSRAILGNKFVTDTTATTEGLKTFDTAGNFAAWSIIGVVHGAPPYIPFPIPPRAAPFPFPALAIKYSTSVTEALNVTVSTEDSKEVSVVGSFNIAGALLPKAAFSAESSYSYGVKTVDSKTDSSATTISVSESQTFEPAAFAQHTPPISPNNVGMVIVSKPTYLSKAYLAKRWNGADFTDQQRNICVTTVLSRALDQFYYRLDDPDAGPIDAPQYKELTEGMPKISEATALSTWANPSVDPVGYISFGISGGQGVDFFTDFASAGTFELAYLTAQGTARSTSRSTTNKETVKASFGVKDLFSIGTSGSFSQTSTLSTSQSTNFTFGRIISGTYPKLPVAPDQPYSKINLHAFLLNAKGEAGAPSTVWNPTRFRDSENSFLLTWKVTSSIPASAGQRSLITFDGNLANRAGTSVTSTPIGDPTFVPREKPLRGTALALDGRRDALLLQGDLATAGPFTASLWVKPEPTVTPITQTLIHQPGRFTLTLVPTTGGYLARFQLGKMALLSSAAEPIEPDRWTYLTVTFERNWGSILQNGVPVAAGLLVDTTTGADRILLGDGPAAHFHGQIDQFGFWAKGLSLAQIRSSIPPSNFTAPTLLTTPKPEVRSLGQSATFTATLLGDGPFTYRWKLGSLFLSDGAGITGSDTAALTVADLRPDREGSYQLVVQGPAGTTHLGPYRLHIAQPPQVLQDPAPQRISLGGRASLRAGVQGRQPITYQWYLGENPVKNDRYINGARTANLQIRAATRLQSGTYHLRATNSDGEVTTRAATVRVR